jgi:hypothetical protein
MNFEGARGGEDGLEGGGEREVVDAAVSKSTRVVEASLRVLSPMQIQGD